VLAAVRQTGGWPGRIANRVGLPAVARLFQLSPPSLLMATLLR